MTDQGSRATITALLYVFMQERGPDPTIPDFSASFGKVTPEDRVEINELYEAARNRVLGIEPEIKIAS